MMPITKDTTETTNQEFASPRTTSTAQPPARLRSEAVSLEIPVKVHGSRVTEVVMGATPHTEPFEEQTTTMIVFSLGGVLKMSTPVAAGQMMVLTNLKTRQDAICRVLKVRNNPNLQAYVEIEFTHSQPGYWGVFFPSDNSELTAGPATPVQPSNLEPEVKGIPSREASRPFATPPSMQASTPAKPPLAAAPQNPAPKTTPAPVSYGAPSAKPGSAFISIGSQEEVQVAASSTLSKNAKRLESIKEDRAATLKKNAAGELANVSGDAFLAASSGATPVASGAEITQIERHISGDPSTLDSAQTFGDFGPSGDSTSSREAFGSTLGVSAAGNLAAGTTPQRNWILIAACAALAVAAAAGGAMFFRGSTNGKSAGSTVAAAPSAPAVESTQNSSQGSAAGQSPYSIPAHPTDPTTSGAVATESAEPARASRAIVTDHVESGAPPAQPAPSVSPRVRAAAVNSRPVASRKAGANQAEAPTLDADMTSPDVGGALAGMVSSSNALPPPPPGAAVRVGGVIKAPKLISSVPPTYPSAATQSMMNGDVVIHAVIDKNGNVTNATVVSGPSMLRDAAVSAVRRWKYSPSLLDGQPIAAEVTVTLKFHP
jgi:TonB family protein